MNEFQKIATAKFPNGIITGEHVTATVWAGSVYWPTLKMIGTISVFENKEGKLTCHAGETITEKELRKRWKA